MSIIQTESGFANVDDAKLYYEVAGKGLPLVMLHAGVADSRQWNNEFAFFATHFRTLRYDLRGYGKSEPVDGAFSHINDLIALLDLLEIREPLVIMGCSMGGGVAMDFALAQPSRVKALIMVDAGPSGLHLDVPAHPKAADAGEAYNASQLDLVAELETQIWFDGMGRTAQEVNPAMRTLAYDMNRLGLSHDAKRLGTRLPDADTPAAERLATLDQCSSSSVRMIRPTCWQPPITWRRRYDQRARRSSKTRHTCPTWISPTNSSALSRRFWTIFLADPDVAEHAHAADRCAHEIVGILAVFAARSRRLMGRALDSTIFRRSG
jgi:3-oxoadipate enol-lactonase